MCTACSQHTRSLEYLNLYRKVIVNDLQIYFKNLKLFCLLVMLVSKTLWTLVWTFQVRVLFIWQSQIPVPSELGWSPSPTRAWMTQNSLSKFEEPPTVDGSEFWVTGLEGWRGTTSWDWTKIKEMGSEGEPGSEPKHWAWDGVCHGNWRQRAWCKRCPPWVSHGSVSKGFDEHAFIVVLTTTSSTLNFTDCWTACTEDGEEGCLPTPLLAKHSSAS